MEMNLHQQVKPSVPLKSVLERLYTFIIKWYLSIYKTGFNKASLHWPYVTTCHLEKVGDCAEKWVTFTKNITQRNARYKALDASEYKVIQNPLIWQWTHQIEFYFINKWIFVCGYDCSQSQNAKSIPYSFQEASIRWKKWYKFYSMSTETLNRLVHILSLYRTYPFEKETVLCNLFYNLNDIFFIR